ncbi:MAG: crossover junction endodeoxyribonuclease RuvC [Parcubacteria group bacterium CG11_big_fil_rev_8_21_14_0_20_39_22]|nr:MAG: crossover junction endodeoxyribonuclease RuvC [Parcubacteria group bacterium CG11_big_fil_rev_8_21_14_0_20_39_22]
MRILGIDPGYERLGIAIIEKNTTGKESYVYSECFKTSPKEPHEKRLSLIAKKIESVIEEFLPSTLAIETLFLNTNQKTAFKVSESRGVLIERAATLGLRVFEYTPLQIKTAVTGYGRSDKNQIISMIPRLIDLPKDHKTQDDEYDAIGVALTCIATEKSW